MAVGVAVAGGRAYLADSEAGIAIFDVSDPFHPVRRAQMSTPDFAYGVAAAGSYAYVSVFGSGLVVVDVSGEGCGGNCVLAPP